MRGSLRILTVAGIGIYIHWTFLLLLAWVFYIQAASAGGLAAGLNGVVFVLAVFACVVLHELGHALTAARFGVRTRDITMLPIGGVARLERIPENPLQEFLIAIAGPAVNVAIAGVLFVVLLAAGGFTPLPAPGPDQAAAAERYMTSVGFFERLLFVNVFLVIFNMIPAFPMDGGRVLRAALASRMPYARATQIAAVVGQVLAGAFGLLGLMTGNLILILIAAFVFLGAGAEAQMARTRSAFDGVPVREAMITDFRALTDADTLADASRELLAGSQQDFPVFSGEQLVGILPRGDLLKALASRGPGAPVAEVMRRDCRPVEETDMLSGAVQRMQESGCTLLPVARRGRIIGLLTFDNIGELMMVRSALRGAPGGGGPAA